MEYAFISFRSRSETVRFSELMKNNGIRNGIINTPKEAGVGCGLSVKFSISDLNAIKRVLRFSGFKTFAGFFLVKNTYGKRTVVSI